MVLVMAMACGEKETTSSAVEATGKPMPLSAEVLDATSALRMKDVVDTLSDDSHGGRVTGSPGYLLSMAYIHEQLEDIGLEPIGLEGDFVYP